MNDYYLTPLQNHKGWKEEFSKWIENAVSESSDFKEEQKISLAWKDGKLLGGGYEHARIQIDEDRGNYKWKERVIVFRSLNLAQTQIAGLEKRLKTAESKIKNLASPEKINRKKDLDDLKAKTAEILKAQDVERLLEITWKEVKTIKEYKRTEKRKGKAREGSYCITSSTYELQGIIRNQKSIKDSCDRCGWRMYVTNASVEKLSFQDAVCFYREGWKIECLFHFLKTHPISIRPLFVREESQLIGLSRFLTIALRLLTHMELMIHTSLDKSGAYVKGIYKGQPQKKTRTPSGILVLEAFEGVSFFKNDDEKCFITQLSKSAELFLDLLDMKNLYQDLVKA
jgi:transposase